MKPAHMKLLIAALLATISLFHYLTPTGLEPLHELYKVLYFIPIILGAFAFGVRGGVLTALVATAIYLPHIMFQWGGSFIMNISRFFMILLYNTLGALTGYLWEQERKQRNFYQQASEDLKESLIKLQQTSDELKQIEGHLRAAERLSTLGELTASLAHEVRNPLGSIRGVAEILRDEPHNKSHAKFIDILLKETARIESVVANYLSLAKQKSLQKASFDVVAVIQSTLALVGPEVRNKNLNVIESYQPLHIPMLGQEDQIRQAILNIVLNAIQASPAHGALEISAQKNGKKIQITVKDKGPGLTKEAAKKMFEPFYTEKADGVGLGLAITKRIVETHKGRLYAAGAPHAGAVLTMEFPA